MANSGIRHVVTTVPVSQANYEDEAHHALIHGNSFPSNPTERQLFYRDDEHKWYIYNGTSWVNLTAPTINKLDDIEDINAPSPSDNDALTWDAATSKWVPKDMAHPDWANIQNKPDWAANPLISAVENAAPKTLAGFACGISGYGYSPNGFPFLVPTAWDRLAFLDKKGGSVVADKAPVGGSVLNVVDGTGSYVEWRAADCPITITLTLETVYNYCRSFFLYFRPDSAPREFRIRFYDSSDALLGEYHIQNWDPANEVCMPGWGWYGTKKITIELIAPKEGYPYIQLFEVCWAYPYGPLFPTLVSKGGDTMYGLLNVPSFRINTAKTPASAGDSGTTGDFCWDSNYIYVCVAPNTWKRAPLSSW